MFLCIKTCRHYLGINYNFDNAPIDFVCYSSHNVPLIDNVFIAYLNTHCNNLHLEKYKRSRMRLSAVKVTIS